MKFYRINNTVYLPVRVKQSYCHSPETCPYFDGESPEQILRQRSYLQKRVDEMENILNIAQKKITSLYQEIAQLKEENSHLTEALSQAQQPPFKRFFTKRQTPDQTPRKRGAPVGHPGTSRRTPSTIDEYIIASCEKCPACGNVNISACNYFNEHLQEDIVILKPITRSFIHLHYWCPSCKKVVSAHAQNEIPKAPIGPLAKSIASYLHYHIKISYDDIQRIFSNLFGLKISSATLLGFDNKIYSQGLPLYESLRKLLPYTSSINADETSWKDDWLWVFTNKQLAYYHIDKHRSSEVVRQHLGSDYKGILTSDFFSAYNSSISAFAKQKCNAHLLQDIKELLEKFPDDSTLIPFCQELKTLIQNALLLHSQFSKLTPEEWNNLKKPLFLQLDQLSQISIAHPKAETLRKRLLKHRDEIFTFLNHPEIEPTNNIAERALRNLVMLRKITFGNRSEQGQKNVSLMTTILQTAKLKGLNQIDVLQTLLTKGLTTDLSQKFGLPQVRAP